MGLSLTDAILRAPQDTFPYTPSAFNFSTFDLAGLAINRFSNFRNAELFPGLTLYVGGPEDTEEETEAYIQGDFDGVYFTDANNNDSYDAGFERKIADIRLFISHDGAYLLEQHNALKDSIRADEIAIFLEVPKGDVFSENVLLIKAGDNARQYAETILHHTFVTEKFNLSEEQRNELLCSLSNPQVIWDKIISVAISIERAIVEGIAELGSAIFGAIGDFFGKTIRITESVWNAGHPDFILGKLEDGIVGLLRLQSNLIDRFVRYFNTLLPKWASNTIKAFSIISRQIADAIDATKEVLETVVAFVCGLWNGLMDLISGIFALVKLLFEGIKASNKYNINEAYYQALALEYLDNFMQSILKVNWGEVIKKAMESQKSLLEVIGRVPGQILKNMGELNHTEIAYYLGYIIFNIIEFAFPPLKLAKLGKLGKLENIFSIFDDVVSGASSAIQRGGRAIQKGATSFVDAFFQLIRGFLNKLEEGTKAFSKWIDEIFLAIKKWMDDVFGGLFKASDEVEELFRRKNSLADDGGVVFRRYQLRTFARKLERRFAHVNLKVEIVTANTPRFRERLRRWNIRNTQGSLAPGPPPVLYVRQKCTQLTMQHEVWHLEDLVRMGTEAFRRMPNWKAEESVWLKVWQTRNRWSEREIVDSYRYYRSTALREGAVPMETPELIALLRKYPK